MRPRLLVLLTSAALAGCGSEPTPAAASPAPSTVAAPSASTTPPSTQTAAASSTSASPATTPSAAPTPTPTAAPSPTSTPSAARRPRSPRLSAADRVRVEEALREGRRLTREGQHTDALARFQEALAIDRGAWRVACEAGFVAWRAENLEAADRLVRDAMNGMPPGFVPEAQRVPTAMCLFNAGLVRQARGEPEAARDMWAESLRLRDNSTVRARLAALPPAEDRRRPWERMPATVTIDEIVSAMRTDFVANGLAGFEGGDLTPDALVLEVEHLGAAPGLEVDRIHGTSYIDEGGGSQVVEALVVTGGGARRVALLGQSYNAGVAISTTDLHFQMELTDVLPGGQPELVARVGAFGGSVAEGSESWGDEGVLLVCSIDEGALACFSVPVRSTYGESVEEDETVTEGYCREATFEGGRVSFSACSDPTSTSPAFIEGTHELRALLSRGELRWPDAWTPLEPVGS